MYKDYEEPIVVFILEEGDIIITSGFGNEDEEKDFLIEDDWG